MVAVAAAARAGAAARGEANTSAENERSYSAARDIAFSQFVGARLADRGVAVFMFCARREADWQDAVDPLIC
jgi:hypothetical protein